MNCALAGAGHDIALVDVLVPEIQRTADEIRAIGWDCLPLEADVSLHSRAQGVVAKVQETFRP